MVVENETRATIGIFGGSGFYQLMEGAESIKVDTPYGPPSSRITLVELGGKKVAFLPRHGRDHSLPPHMINYRANLFAMKSLGVERVIGPCASGSLQPHIMPGDFVLCDQFVDRTNGRKDTYYDGPTTTHIGMADPYCQEMREVALEEAKKLGLRVHPRGTVVVIQGPRFSTRAESRWFSQMGWEVINMTQYPEVVLARELGMCYLNISLITDYDVGLEGRPDIKPVSQQEVIRVFQENNEKLRQYLEAIVRALPEKRKCECARAVETARM
ncbi:MAG: S-methyl-5'-thioadenosine phosphorylase [Clostridia bacterium]|nr:S-methyl-5'-thioadenosine phosphorylase [Clostridia bacterium]